MDLDNIPKWVWIGGAVIVVIALLSRNKGGGVTTTTVGPQDSAYAENELQVRASGFDKVVGFAGNVLSQEVTLAGMSNSLEQTRIQTSSAQQIAQINADTERARVGAALTSSQAQTSASLAAQRSANKSGVINTVVSTIGSLAKGFFGL